MTSAPRELDLIDETSGEEAAAARAEERRQAAVHLVNALYRLIRVLGIHTESNQAVRVLVDGMVAAVGAYCEVSKSFTASVLFAEDTVFVNGQMLKASRDTYATAIKLGQYYERCGISEVTFDRLVTAEQVSTLARATHLALQGKGAAGSLIEASLGGVKLRKIHGSTTRGDGTSDETAAARVVRTYATSIVVLRQFYADLQAGDYRPQRRIKRVAQKLVSSGDEEARVLLGLTGSRAAESDRAGLAVNTAILASLMARALTSDRAILGGVATAALLYDVGEPRLASATEIRSGVRRLLNDDELDRLPASVAAVLIALGRIQTRSISSTVAAWEARWLQRASRLGPPYGGRRLPTLLARILVTARTYTELMGTSGTGSAPSADDVLQLMSDRASEETERAVVKLLVAALGVFPLGATVELTTGELAMVIGVPALPVNTSRPMVRLLSDADGNLIEGGADVDLASPPAIGAPPRSIRRVVEADAQHLKEMRAYVLAMVGGRKASFPVRRGSVEPPLSSSAPRAYSGRYSSVPAQAQAPVPQRPSAKTRQVKWEDYEQRDEEAKRTTLTPARAPAAKTRQVKWEDYQQRDEEAKRTTLTPARAPAAPTRQVRWEDYRDTVVAVQPQKAPDDSEREEKKKAPRTRMMRWANTEALFEDLEAQERARRDGRPNDGEKE